MSNEGLVFDANQRRVLGVLIEKALTTPQQYPLSVNATVTGCNQTSNRAPIAYLSESEVEETLNELRERHLTTVVLPLSGRVSRWKQELVKVFGFNRAELAVLGELLLRGAQSEGDLRSRASRMQPIEDLGQLRGILEKLAMMTPRMVVRLSPPEMQRGVRWTHALCSPDEMAKIIQKEGREEQTAVGMEKPASQKGLPSSKESAELEGRVEALEALVAELSRRLEDLETRPI